jgi:hypothetical protein
MSSPLDDEHLSAQQHGQQQQSPNSNNRRRASSNAFEILMTNRRKSSSSSSSSSTNNKRQKKATRSRFVLCPAGCGKHILENKINIHLDQCITVQSQSSDAAAATTTTGTPNALSQPQQPKDISYDIIESATTFPSSNASLHGPSSKSDVEPSFDSDQKTFPTTPPNHSQGKKTDDSYTEIVHQEAEASTDTGTNNVFAADGAKHHTKSTELLATSNVSSSVPQKEQVATMAPICGNNNAFEHMMKRSRTVFSQPKKNMTNTTYYFCLHGVDGRVSLGEFPPLDLNITWSTTVRVRDTNNNNNNSNGTTMMLPVVLGTCVSPPPPPPRTVATITTTTTTNCRLVRHHSRLSVSVLKSMLQKCIRRRRPMPAVRVAMELADKALVELLRRLPIIVLEDSTLHPDFPLLVWLMMACSSSSSSSNSSSSSSNNGGGGGGGEYTLPPVMMQRVLQIIYEVASCQWIDPLPAASFAHDDDDDGATNISLYTILQDQESSLATGDGIGHTNSNHASNLLIWSMLARASYGGMTCDVRMLNGYARQWKRRFSLHDAAIAANTTTQQQEQQQQQQQVKKQDQEENPMNEMDKAATTSDATTPTSWYSLLTNIHERARQQSRERVAALFGQQQQKQQQEEYCLERLALNDTCLQGVDYHCCFGILDHLLSDLELVHLSLDLLSLSSNALPKETKERRLHLSDIWKSCMWVYSSGVNHRRPISVLVNDDSINGHQSKLKEDSDSAPSKDKADPYKELWSLAAPKVLAFQKAYVQQRLA